MGIHYVTVTEGKDRFDWQWLAAQPALTETGFLRHVRLPAPFVIKVDGRESRCVMYAGPERPGRTPSGVSA
jgi:hypothetical protein